MFVNSTFQVGITQRVVATLVACAVVLFTIGAYNIAQAANLTSVSNTLSDSDLSVTSSHTIAFTIPTGSTLANTDTVTVTFPTGFTGVAGVAGVTVTVDAVADPATGFVAAGQDLTFAGIDATAGQEVIVVVADGDVTNPGTAGSYEFVVDTGNGDAGKTRVAIIDNVVVTAIVETSFDFVITGLATTTAVNGENTTGSTSPTSIPYGVLNAGVAEFLAQQLNVTTNAANGFVVTVEKDAPLQSSTGADIDDFVDGVQTDTPTAWASPNGTLAFGENGWGHWGLVAVDNDLQGAGTDFTATDQFVSVPDAPRAVFAHDGPSDGTTTGGSDATTDDVGQTLVGYKVEITPLQEAGDDYNTTLTYVATPTF